MAKVEFHFDFGSPNAYLAHLIIPEIERRAGVTFEYVPILLGGVFKLTNNRSPAEKMAGIKNRLEYERLEFQRFIRRYGIKKFAARSPPNSTASLPATSTKYSNTCGRNQRTWTNRRS